MKIALVGAPESGKTEVAEELAALLDEGTVAVVDDYVSKLSDATNIAFDHFAGYLNNLQVAFKRLEAEQEAATLDCPVITCGTLMETTLYCTLHGQVVMSAPDTREKQIEFARGDTAGRTLALLVHDSWRYDHVFYLPYADERRDTSWNSILDTDLPSALEQFFIRYEVLTGSTEERAQEAYESIRRSRARAAGLAQAE